MSTPAPATPHPPTPPRLSPRRPTLPRALLLDFGGVIAESDRHVDTPENLIARVDEVTGRTLPLDQIRADIRDGATAHSQWRDGVGRAYAPVELSHERVWADFVTADWPVAAREAVAAHATELTHLWVDRGDRWRLRDGVTDLLALAGAAEIPVAVVSNVSCGAPLRAFLDRAGVTGAFAAQIYSDEVGVRKPNPATVLAATDRIGVDPARAWFVGDKLLRDVLAARRAGIGYVVLVHRPDRTVPEHPWLAPDTLLDTMVDVASLLRSVTAAHRDSGLVARDTTT